MDGSVKFVSNTQKILRLINLDGKNIGSTKSVYVRRIQISTSARCARYSGAVGMCRFWCVSSVCSNEMMDLDLRYNDGTRQCRRNRIISRA